MVAEDEVGLGIEERMLLVAEDEAATIDLIPLLHKVDFVLGINWLQLVNPVVDWSGARLYVPNAVHTTLL